MPSVDQNKVKKIALDFLEQYHDASTIESSHFEDGVWTVFAKVGLITQQIKKILIDTNGKILSYSDIRIPGNKYAANQILVAFAVEKILLNIGRPVYETVTQKLHEDYGYDLFDCYENPDCLNIVMKEILGENYSSVVEMIKEQLSEEREQKTVDFLAVISK